MLSLLFAWADLLSGPWATGSSTTTVVMRMHETWDESVVAAHVVDNGFDGPRSASFCETVTRL